MKKMSPGGARRTNTLINTTDDAQKAVEGIAAASRFSVDISTNVRRYCLPQKQAPHTRTVQLTLQHAAAGQKDLRTSAELLQLDHEHPCSPLTCPRYGNCHAASYGIRIIFANCL